MHWPQLPPQPSSEHCVLAAHCGTQSLQRPSAQPFSHGWRSVPTFPHESRQCTLPLWQLESARSLHSFVDVAGPLSRPPSLPPLLLSLPPPPSLPPAPLSLPPASLSLPPLPAGSSPGLCP